MDSDRNAAPVVFYADGAISPYENGDVRRLAGHELVDAVVDQLVDEVVQTGLARGADVHARPEADGFQSFEDLDVAGRVCLSLPGVCFNNCHTLLLPVE